MVVDAVNPILLNAADSFVRLPDNDDRSPPAVAEVFDSVLTKAVSDDLKSVAVLAGAIFDLVSDANDTEEGAMLDPSALGLELSTLGGGVED